jgi:hydroxymethylpyrimidine pyrophosphatase-like HAD family hydrolase
VTRRDFTTVSGRTYFFAASLNEKAKDIQVVSVISPLGGLVASAAAYNDRQGPINLTPISESEAKQVIAAAQRN